MGRIQALKQHYGDEQAKVLNQLAGLGYRAHQLDDGLTAATRNNLSEKDRQNVRAAAQAAAAEEERQAAKAEYIRLDAERTAAIEEARLAAEAELSPQGVSPEAVLLVSKMTEQEILDAVDAALTLGENGLDTIKLCFAMARQKDFDAASARIVEAVPAFEEAYEDILEASSEPDLGPEESFEMFADEAPTQQSILGAPMADIDAYARMKQ